MNLCPDPCMKSRLWIPSRFYMNSESMDSKRFAIEYKSLFDREPARSFPVYSALRI